MARRRKLALLRRRTDANTDLAIWAEPRLDDHRQRKLSQMSHRTTLVPVDSSAIRAVGYDGHTLIVEFHTGRIYDHPNVPYSVYAGLMRASSMGGLLQQKHPRQIQMR